MALHRRIKWYAIGIMAASVLLWVSSANRPLPPAASPRPNGYFFLTAAGKLAQTGGSGYGSIAPDKLRDYVSRNAAALELLHRGLQFDCGIPYGKTAPDYFERHFPDLAAFKNLAFALAAHGKLAENEGNAGEAARDYLAAIRFGHKLGHLGLAIDNLVGFAVESIGIGPLEKLTATLNADQCREVMIELERLDATRMTSQEVWEADRLYSKQRYSILRYYQLRIWAMWVDKSLNSQQAMVARYDLKQNAITKQERELMLVAAARAFELDKGRKPGRVQDLVPEYLRKAPVDPSTGNALALPR